MASTQGTIMQSPFPSAAADARDPALADLLRLFGTGATGSILLALQGGPLRTKDLTTRVPGFGPRTVYRYVEKLAALGAVEREEEPGVPSKVVYELTDPCGVELCELIDRFSQTWLEVLPDGGIVPHSWGCLTLLGDLWGSGMFKELIEGPRTATELARVDHDLSFHQVSRRTSLFMAGNLLREADDGRRRRRYELTEEARQRTSLIAGLGSWRRRNFGSHGDPGLTADEVADLLRAALPLVALPGHTGKSFRLSVGDAEGENGGGGEAVWAKVGPDGRVTGPTGPATEADAWGQGGVEDWIEALVEGNPVQTGGDRAAIESCLSSIHAGFWGGSAVETR